MIAGTLTAIQFAFTVILSGLAPTETKLARVRSSDFQRRHF